MSSLDKDPHVICPNHTGWQCSMERRCDVCKDWSAERMRLYCNLQDSKARKKAYRERKRVESARNSASSGHNVSDSSLEETPGKQSGSFVIEDSKDPSPLSLVKIN